MTERIEEANRVGKLLKRGHSAFYQIGLGKEPRKGLISKVNYLLANIELTKGIYDTYEFTSTIARDLASATDL